MTNTPASPAVRRIRRWVRVPLAIAVPAAALAVPAITAAPAMAASDCTTDCVAVSVSAGVNRFTFGVSSAFPVKLAGRITTQDGSTQISTTTTNGYGTSYSLGVSNLKQGTSYRYDLFGTDATGNTWKETGYFSTLVRDVSVHFSTVQITDDGDTADAGEIVAAVQLLDDPSASCQRKALAPFSMTSTRTTSSGSPMSVGSASDLACSAVSPTISLQGHMADDDTDWYDDCASRWPWHWGTGSWGGHIGGDDCADWNYSHSDLTDPITALGVTNVSKAFTSTARDEDISVDWDAGPEWVLTGTATFTHRLPAVALPATSGAPAKLPLSLTPKPGAFSVAWTAPTVPGVSVYSYLVRWREAGAATWSSTTVKAPSTSAAVSGLKGAAAYQLEVLAQDINAKPLLRSSSSVTTQALPQPVATTIGGWDTASASLAPGTAIPFTATVSGEPRPVQLQVRRLGTDAWTTHATLTTDASDQLSGSLPVLVGIHEWRLSAPQSGSFMAATSAARTVTSTSAITGFSTTKVTKPVGTILNDAVTVTPGAGRQVLVQHKKAGATTWTTYKTLTADQTGAVTAQLKAFSGSTAWRVRVAKDATFGAAATSATRTVVGQ